MENKQRTIVACNIECDCGDLYHRIKLVYEVDPEYGNDLVFGTCPHTGSFWNRIKTCWKILTGQEYWFADTYITDKDKIQTLCNFFEDVATHNKETKNENV